MDLTDGSSCPTRLSLTVERDLLAAFCLLTGGGFPVDLPRECSVRELLCRQLGIPRDYLDRRIQTIFLNFRPVDNPDAATVTPGATVALSAAMPGLVGAIFRRGGYYAVLRSRVPGDGPTDGPAPGRQGYVLLKLFNMVQQELGPEFLRRGIRIPGTKFADLLRRSADTLRAGILAAEINGTPTPPATLFHMAWTDREIRLAVCSSS